MTRVKKTFESRILSLKNCAYLLKENQGLPSRPINFYMSDKSELRELRIEVFVRDVI